MPRKHVSPYYNPTHSEITAVKFQSSLVSQSVVRRVLQEEVGCGHLWMCVPALVHIGMGL